MEIRPGEYMEISTSCDTREVADSIAGVLLESRLVACVQAENIHSQYWWKGEIQRQDEIRITMKCRREDCDKVEQVIRREHSYELPAIVMTEVAGGGGDYFGWMDEVTRDRAGE